MKTLFLIFLWAFTAYGQTPNERPTIKRDADTNPPLNSPLEQGQTRTTTRTRGGSTTSTPEAPANRQPSNEPSAEAKAKLANFRQLYDCSWPKVEGARPFNQVVSCAQLSPQSCSGAGEAICTGVVKCKPSEIFQEVIDRTTDEAEKNQLKVDPQYLFTTVEYAASCKAKANRCPSALDCVAEDMTTMPWQPNAEWERAKQKILRNINQ